MGGADSRDIIDLGPGLLSRLGASIRARGAQVIRMDMHSGWIALGFGDRLLKKAGVQHYVFTAYTLAQEYG